MWRRFSCQPCLGMSDSVLREWRRSFAKRAAPHHLLPPPRGGGGGVLLRFRCGGAPLLERDAGQHSSNLCSLRGPRGPRIAATRKVLGDARERDGECQLFLLTAAGSCEVVYPETRSPGWKSASVGRACPLHATRPSLAREPLKTPLASGARGSAPRRAGLHKAVPQTAAGLQGEQPLVSQDNVGKGSRQISSVTSGEGVALRAERVAAPAGV